ncbi:MAG: pyrroline-5-carboxylate reductase [Oscillospiraceae bacterium]|nr:pyrroline-5-carboxylate reductase [Oscillospiraceae bacterium]
MKLTVIGAGNMASALVNGILKSGMLEPENINITDTDAGKLTVMKDKGVNTYSDNKEAVKNSDIILLAVKPNIYPAVLKEISGEEAVKNAVTVTIAPGISIATVKETLGFDAKVVRTMPNTPAMAGAGMTALCYESPVTEDDFENVRKLFATVGECELMSEKLVSASVSVSGSSPAYVYMLIEAMADAAVYDGMPRATAYKMAAQSVLGSAKMVLETGKHPGELKDMVCSPGGTTIGAVRVLEEEGFRSAVINAMIECNRIALSMGKNK